MSWRKIKTFLIVLFLIINIYLIFSTDNIFNITSQTSIDKSTISKTAQLLDSNFGIKVDKNIIPDKIKNLNNINVTNVIYLDEFMDTFDFKKDNSFFYGEIKTDTFSYNEEKAKEDLTEILDKLNIDKNSYKMYFNKGDDGLTCSVFEYISDYQIFNSYIYAHFLSSKIVISGVWYLPESTDIISKDSSKKMNDITGVLFDMASNIEFSSDISEIKVDDIKYGYFVSYYDENAVNKSATAIASYLITLDNNTKFYYDALNGKLLKQEV